MTTRIYLTHCSARKKYYPKAKKVSPDQLYASERIQRFMNQCKATGVKWAIFSDLYGVWFPWIRHKWYEKSPGEVTNDEFNVLLSDFDGKLKRFKEVRFYYNPGRFHPLYKRLLKKSRLLKRIRMFTHYWEVE
jgi:hypothetical protein